MRVATAVETAFSLTERTTEPEPPAAAERGSCYGLMNDMRPTALLPMPRCTISGSIAFAHLSSDATKF